MNFTKIIEKCALGFAACSLLAALFSPLLHNSAPKDEIHTSLSATAICDMTEVFGNQEITTHTTSVDTTPKRKRIYTPYADIMKERAALIEQLTEKHKDDIAHECSTHTKGIIYRVNLPSPDSCKTLFLTFDACISGFDSMLIKYLIINNIKATLFVTARWIANKPIAMQQLCKHLDIFDIENHGTMHRPASVQGCTEYGIHGTENMAELVAEVELGADMVERATGKRPLFFRSGTAFADNVAIAAIGDMGYRFVGFSITADAGATLPRNAVKQRVLSAQHGDVVLMHFNSKNSETCLGFVAALEEMKQNGVCVKFEKLSDFADKLEAY